MSTVGLPKPGGVTRLLSMLFARGVEAVSKKPASADPTNVYVVGTYQNDAEEIVAIALLDLPLAAYAGAALTMIPAGAAEESIESGRLSESIEENVSEVLNICVGFFGRASAPPIRLSQIHRESVIPEEVSATLRDGARRLDLVVSIENYGEGSLTLLAA